MDQPSRTLLCVCEVSKSPEASWPCLFPGCFSFPRSMHEELGETIRDERGQLPF